MRQTARIVASDVAGGIIVVEARMHLPTYYSPALDAYDLGPDHPFRPERVSLAIALMRAYGLFDDALRLVEPVAISREELQLVHDAAYIDTVIRVSGPGGLWTPERGIGPGDTPAFPGMHEAASLIAGATLAAVRSVASGSTLRAFSPAGGLHHAHRDRAAGFCVYNDVAVGIAAALVRDPRLRIAYVDIDAHHGDGVQEAFYADPRVLTVSLHEDGRYLYPGTGSVTERGTGAGAGTALSVPMPPLATDECYELAFDEAVALAVRAFAPDLLVVQCGADAHWSDPLTSLGVTLHGFQALYTRIVQLAEDTCGGRLVACGGGGYSWRHLVPRAWTMLAATIAGRALSEELPPEWLARISPLAVDLPGSLSEDAGPDLPDGTAGRVLDATAATIERLRDLGAI